MQTVLHPTAWCNRTANNTVLVKLCLSGMHMHDHYCDAMTHSLERCSHTMQPVACDYMITDGMH